MSADRRPAGLSNEEWARRRELLSDPRTVIAEATLLRRLPGTNVDLLREVALEIADELRHWEASGGT